MLRINYGGALFRFNDMTMETTYALVLAAVNLRVSFRNDVNGHASMWQHMQIQSYRVNWTMIF